MSFVCWREGYTKAYFFDDLKAGISVGLIALPLAMAFAIGSGLTPEKGLYTAIVAGFLISLLGGSRVQIGGPTGAFIVIVYGVVQQHGYEGLVIATLLAGVMMILMGLARFGVFLKFIPYPVTVGFTTGIAVSLFSGVIKDFFGLCIDKVPPNFIDKWILYFKTALTCNPWATALALLTLFSIFFLRKINPRLPCVIISVVLAALASLFLGLPVETIQTKFGGIPSALPDLQLPVFSYDKVVAVFPDAIAIALLAAIESLLSAVVADGLTGHRHRSNCELIAQGFANIGSVIFGGIPATGAISRTTANIQLGAKTPVAGMIHALTLLLVMLFLAPIAAKVPLAALAAVLIYVAWNMGEFSHFFAILKGQRSDAFVLVTTFLLTVLIDLTVAVQVGVLLAAMLFVKRMSDSTTVDICQVLLEENAKEFPGKHDSDILFRTDIPKETVVFEINGPFFFAVSDLLNDQWRQTQPTPKTFILRLRKMPSIDASGIKALNDFIAECHSKGVTLLVTEIKPSVFPVLNKGHVISGVGKKHIFSTLDDAINYENAHTS